MASSGVVRANGKEKKSRSLAKAVSWRLVAFVVLATISFAFTGSWHETTLIAVVYSVVQIFVYFAHERAWSGITWGKPDALEQLPPASEVTPDEADVIVRHLRNLGYIE